MIIQQVHMLDAWVLIVNLGIRQNKLMNKRCMEQSRRYLVFMDKVFHNCQIFHLGSIEHQNRLQQCYQRALQHHHCRPRVHYRSIAVVRWVVQHTIDFSTLRRNQLRINKNTIFTHHRINCWIHSSPQRNYRAMEVHLSDVTLFMVIITRIYRIHSIGRIPFRKTDMIACQVMTHTTRIQIRLNSRWTLRCLQFKRDSDRMPLMISSQFQAWRIVHQLPTHKITRRVFIAIIWHKIALTTLRMETSITTAMESHRGQRICWLRVHGNRLMLLKRNQIIANTAGKNWIWRTFWIDENNDDDEYLIILNLGTWEID